MSSEEENDAACDLDQRYMELCLAVNMDKPTMEQALQDFQNTSKNYTLEGDGLHWLVCALYVKSRESIVPTVSGMNSKGNFVSLNKLLKAAGLSFVCFLRKMEKWLEMNTSIASDFRERIASLERSFCVNTPIFKKFLPLFQTVFLDPFDPQNTPTKHKSRRPRKVQCTTSDIFKFCWTTFIHAKATQYRAITEDLVSSFQLLLSVINFCFANALQCNHRAKLLNPDFAGLPENWDKPDFKPPTTPPDIIGLLVDNQAASGLSRMQADNFSFAARVINRHQFTSYVRSLLNPEGDVLSGDADTLSNLFLPQNFEKNKKAIDMCYEEYILTEGDFDERIFLCDDVEQELGTPIKQRKLELKAQSVAVDNMSPIKISIQRPESDITIKPNTPLTNRMLLAGRELGNTTPVSRAVQSVAKLQLLLHGQEFEFSAIFIKEILHNSSEMSDSISSRLQDMGVKFLDAYCKPYKDQPGGARDFGETRLHMIKTLYFKSLQNIIWQEKKRMEGRKNGGSCEQLLTRDDFHLLLFGCCVEVVLFSYHSTRVFPWVLEATNTKAYYFYKVIELMIRAEEGLSREVVKHLNHIEEKILESMAWQSDSPLWEAIENLSNVPSCEEVNYPHQVTPVAGIAATMKVHPRVRQVADQTNALSNSNKSESNFISNTMVHDRFSSPVPGSVKRCLFQSDEGNIINAAVRTPTVVENADNQKPKRTGSLALFFRKVYHMAGIRVKDLCDKLNIPVGLQAKVWTTFEQSLIRCTFLMRNRHMDQLIMCAVYVLAKVTQHDQSFQEIMRCYRSQPQASSHVYRNVLIHEANPDDENESDIEVRDDLIQFYNKIYVPALKDFVKKFSTSSNANMEAPPLSPMPTSRCVVKSPRKVVGSYQIYISPHKICGETSLMSTSPALEYSFQRSPSTNLRDFNAMISRHKPIQRKRTLDFSKVDDFNTDAGNHALASKLQKVHDDRTKLK
uniref:retinoblastoma-like protein 1 n=1 Tax=Styela clava TaxID=7725 RepID=UPI00193AD08A|nr:retinoblastoma-like protein 1 [Styela clava]